MPRLSDTMEEGTVAKWFKKVGDQINEGDILAEIETDKATMEFESFNEGKLLYIGIEEGGNAPVDTLLAIIGEKGEDISDLISGSKLETPIEKTKNEVTKEVEEINEVKTISEGVEIITMPRLSDTMEEGTVAKWNKSVGDKVNEGDILAEIETDKATMEFESFYQGTLLHIGLNEGQSASVDSLLAIIGKEGTDVDKVLSSLSSISNSIDVKDDIKPSEDKLIPQKRDDVPLVNVFGGKITTYRKLAENVMEKVGVYFPQMPGPWTAEAHLPGGNFPVNGVADLIDDLRKDYPFLSQKWAERLVKAYGREAFVMLGSVRNEDQLGVNFGASLTQKEVEWLIKEEFATSVDDILWRRTKLGLRLSDKEVKTLKDWMSNQN